GFALLRRGRLPRRGLLALADRARGGGGCPGQIAPPSAVPLRARYAELGAARGAGDGGGLLERGDREGGGARRTRRARGALRGVRGDARGRGALPRALRRGLHELGRARVAARSRRVGPDGGEPREARRHVLFGGAPPRD